ncbi:MAG: amine oxidase [Candidatus Goldiibacteriota bacterium HGW-Goldbacteria-1]|jgi:protoporphyrinogen oxidase|nr:MAG: amine oxidase [Candidatus Goldiibacteriota bacterium HGW-Goldbacteria-1]
MLTGVVGGGIAGLVAAYRLSKAGHQVFVFEAEEKLGGLAQSMDFAGTKLDMFYRHIFKSDLDIVNLIDELQLESQMMWIESKVGFYTGGKTYPFTTPMDLLSFPVLPIIDRIKLGLMALYLQRVNDWKKYEKITAKEWVSKYVSKNVYDKVWGPLMNQKFGPLADTVAMTWLYGRIHSRVASREGGGAKEVLGYMKGSYQVLVDTLENAALKEGARIMKNTPISKVVLDNGKVKGVVVNGQEHIMDSVVLTCAPAISRKLVSFDKEYDERLSKMKYHGAMNLIMRTKKSLSKTYWLNVAEKDSPFVAVIEHTNLVPGEFYGGDTVVYLSKYLNTEDELYKASDEKVKDTFFDYLKKIFPEFSSDDVLEYRVKRAPYSQPIVGLEFSKIKLDYRTPIKGLYSANMTQVYPEDRGMSYSVKLGNEVSNIMMEDNKA